MYYIDAFCESIAQILFVVFFLDIANDMNQRTHLDDYIYGRIVDKSEDCSMRNVVNFGIVKSATGYLKKRFYENRYWII